MPRRYTTPWMCETWDQWLTMRAGCTDAVGAVGTGLALLRSTSALRSVVTLVVVTLVGI